MPDRKIGAIEWRDLTIENAEDIKNFYAQVVGWKTEPISMGDYNDFVVKRPGDDETVAGICHARGPNAKIPPQWMMYVRVADVKVSAASTVEMGGEVIDGPKTMHDETYCVIRDPGGAVLTLVST